MSDNIEVAQKCLRCFLPGHSHDQAICPLFGQKEKRCTRCDIPNHFKNNPCCPLFSTYGKPKEIQKAAEIEYRKKQGTY